MRKSVLFAIAFFILTFCSIESYADPLIFTDVKAHQNKGFTSIDLFTHPGAVLELTGGSPPFENSITFSVHLFGVLPVGTTDILRLTLNRGGQAVEISDQTLPYSPNGSCCNDFIDLRNFEFTDLPYRLPDGSAPPGAVLFTLTVDIIRSSPDFVIPSGVNAGQRVDSYTYSFYVVKPIPEPTTIVLLGLGLSGSVSISLRRRRS